MSTPVPEWDDVEKVPPGRSKPPPPRAIGCLIVVLMSVAIVWALVAFGIQTRIGCDLVANLIHRQTGCDVTVGGASLAWPADLVLTDVQTQPTSTPLGSFKTRELRVGWRWGGLVEVSLSGMRMELMKIASGWVPRPLAAIGALEDVRQTFPLIEAEPLLASLEIRDGGIVWNGPDGERIAGADGVGLSVRPVEVGDRRMVVFEVSARAVHRPGGIKGIGVRRLWLASHDAPYREVEYEGIWDGDDIAIHDWWSEPAGVVKRGSGHER